MNIKDIIMDKIDYDLYCIDLSNVYINTDNINTIIEILNEVYIEHIKIGYCIVRDTENIYPFICQLFIAISNLHWIKSLYIEELLFEIIIDVYNGKIMLSYLLENSSIPELELTVLFPYGCPTANLELYRVLSNSNIKKLHTNIEILYYKLNCYEQWFLNTKQLHSLEISHNEYRSDEHHMICYKSSKYPHIFDFEREYCYKLPSKIFINELISKILSGDKKINSIYVNLCCKNMVISSFDYLNKLILLLIEKNQIVSIIVKNSKYKYSNEILEAAKNNISLKYCHPIIPNSNTYKNSSICKLLLHFLITIRQTTFVQYNGQSTIFNGNTKILPKNIA